ANLTITAAAWLQGAEMTGAGAAVLTPPTGRDRYEECSTPTLGQSEVPNPEPAAAGARRINRESSTAAWRGFTASGYTGSRVIRTKAATEGYSAMKHSSHVSSRGPMSISSKLPRQTMRPPSLEKTGWLSRP